MVVATNSPFLLVENPEFKKFAQLLRPGVRLADRKTIGGSLLDHVYEEEMGKVRKETSGLLATLSVDGWSTRAGAKGRA